jgi:hypothetical protein
VLDGIRWKREVLHSVPNSDGSYIVHVVTEDCGQAYYVGEIYSCSIRLDIEVNASYFKRAYYMTGSCDAEIRWLDKYSFEVTNRNGERVLLNTVDLGIMP